MSEHRYRHHSLNCKVGSSTRKIISDKWMSERERERERERENTRWVSFDIKFTRQGFENACWHREACRAIQHAFSKPSLVNLISKDANLVFYLSANPLLNTLQTSDYDVILRFVLIQRHKRRHSKSATSSWPDKGNMPWDRKRLLGHVETIQWLIKAVTVSRLPWGLCTKAMGYTNKLLWLANSRFAKS